MQYSPAEFNIRFCFLNNAVLRWIITPVLEYISSFDLTTVLKHKWTEQIKFSDAVNLFFWALHLPEISLQPEV